MSSYPKTTKIVDLRIYPIKSCRGISIKSSTLTKKGLQYDRCCMFVDAARKFITIREKPEMTLIQTAIEERPDEDEENGPTKPWLKVTFPAIIPKANKTTTNETKDQPTADQQQIKDETESQSQDFTVDYNSPTTITIPLSPTQSYLDTHTKLITTEIWKMGTDAHAFTDATITTAVATFFNAIDPSSASTQDIRLVLKGPTPRPCRGNGDPTHLGRTEFVNFPDVLPIQIANAASLSELNGRLKDNGSHEITIERFRPNIIVDSDNLEAWEEDEWKVLRVNPPPSTVLGSLAGLSGVGAAAAYVPGNESGTGFVDVDVVARCARCHVPNVDPDSAVPDKKEPWGTLYGYRRVDEGVKYKPCFGMLCCPRGEGAVSVGMEVVVREVMGAAGGKGEHRYVKGF